MAVSVRSFSKINFGLCIGERRPDGFHDLRTVYQTIALHDVIRVQVERGSGIEIRCGDPRVPRDETNTCFRIVDRAMAAFGARRRVIIEIEKRLPVQGGLGAGSSNAVATLLGLERALKKQLSGSEKLRVAAEVGSDLPQFLVGGTVLGVGRGEEVYPLLDLPATACVIATPEIGVSTPKAFADWDLMMGGTELRSVGQPGAAAPTQGVGTQAVPGSFDSAQELRPGSTRAGSNPGSKLTALDPSDRMMESGRAVSAWLGGFSQDKTGKVYSGVPAMGRGRAETLLLDLVRTGIENDFERVVFPQYPELREVKSALVRAGAFYASLSGSGSALYGLFRSRVAAERAAARLRKAGTPAVATVTLTRQQYWKKLLVSGS